MNRELVGLAIPLSDGYVFLTPRAMRIETKYQHHPPKKCQLTQSNIIYLSLEGFPEESKRGSGMLLQFLSLS